MYKKKVQKPSRQNAIVSKLKREGQGDRMFFFEAVIRGTENMP